MFVAERIPYHQTGGFSKIVIDYLAGAENLLPFYSGTATEAGVLGKIEERSHFTTDRSGLVTVLVEQYRAVTQNNAVHQNIQRLLSPQTFTITTAHQPNLFTGPLYFIYKILHVIKLAAELTQRLPAYYFVPVYYMGSEDADFAELNHTYVDGKRLEWRKEQGGAVGRMLVDKTLLALIDELEGQLLVEAHGAEVIAMLRSAYTPGKTVQQATFELVNDLYGGYGLVVLIPDEASLKKQMHRIFEDDLFNHRPSQLVQETSEQLAGHYNTQAHPRPINLFYLKDAVRERLEEKEGRFTVLNTTVSFSAEELRTELALHPERFSPNVILRGIYQETILPNILFIGGGGETAYWLQLKNLFAYYGVPYPVLLLRNSFLVMEKKWQVKLQQLHLSVADLFKTEGDMLKKIALQQAQYPVLLNGKVEQATALFSEIQAQAARVDPTLQQHVAAIKARSVKALEELEKKLLRAEKRKHGDAEAQVKKIKAALFPNGGLQERAENFSRFYAKWGRSFIDELYKHSLGLEQEFVVLKESRFAVVD